MEFKNRLKELKLLDELYRKGSPKLILVYGRRRVGKTELLKEFLKKHNGLYLLGRQESELDQLKTISAQVAAFFNDGVVAKNPFMNWDSFFLYIAEKPRIPLIFDEFPYMVQSSSQLPSILQDHWDNRFSRKNSFIILCGSSISMMERLVSHTSPLYGRRTEQLLLEPLSFRDACLFFPASMSVKDKVLYYAILGGVPAYLLEFEYTKSRYENLVYNLLQKNKFLYDDVSFILREELKEPRNYFSLLYSLSKGNTRIGQIVNDTGLEKSFVTKYLSVLAELQLVERRVPLTERNPRKSRSGIYLIKDNFVKFWFKFIFENQEYVEQDKQEKLARERILPSLDAFAGRLFEDVVLSELIRNKRFSNYLFGRWWDRTSEADIVGMDKEGRKLLVGEVKFGALTKQELKAIEASLLQKAQLINRFGFKVEFLIVCLSHERFDGETTVLKFSDLIQKN